MSFPKSDKIWMNGKLVAWDDAKIHIGSHVIHYGSAVFEGAALLRHARGLGRLPARRAHRAPLQLREDLPDGRALHARTSWTRPSSRRSAPTRWRPATSGRSSIAATASSASTRSPAPSTWRSWSGTGARTSATRRSSRASTSASARGRAWRQHAAGDGQDAPPTTRTRSSSRWRRSPTATPRASRSTSTGYVTRRQRREPLPRPRRHPLHAAARLARSCRASPATRVITLARRLGHPGRRGAAARARCSTSPTRSSSSAPRPRSRRSGRWTRSRSARASAARSPRRCSGVLRRDRVPACRTSTAG